MITDERLSAQIYNKGKTGTPQEKGSLLLRPEEALYCDYRKDLSLTAEERGKFSNQNYIVYKDLKERGLIVKVDENGLRLFDRQTSTQGQSSAIVISKNYKEEIDFSDIFNELYKGLDRRVQLGIIDAEKDVVYYVTKIMEWTDTKRKEGNERNTNEY